MNVPTFAGQPFCWFNRSYSGLPIRPKSSTTRYDAAKLPQRRPRAQLISPNAESLLDDLCSESQARQLVALVHLSSLPPGEGIWVLRKSDVLTSRNLQVRVSAFATLGKLGIREEGRTLIVALESDPDHSIRAAAASGLGDLLRPNDGEGVVRGQGDALEALVRAAEQDAHFIVRYAALVSVGELGNPAALDAVLRVVRDLSAPALEATAAVYAIGQLANDDALTGEILDAVSARAGDREDLVRAAVVRTLGRWSNANSVPELLQRMKGDEKRFGQSTHVQAILDDVLGG
ncbi:hypothetical protein BWQ96_06807 [Gracilariopsis chorda]|uniref:HEAT repeat domain-containing protein n=1 Tax=Gracilariopsis chorda TaxID=448386 RepID=A0A2V3IMY1_9FLOR|nr:hypothetical protein BWQ96_06807 [Gracilariopsis chorda]|eukprot:PXF43417.1 hypothetical protein BWQ96_06807 [Gracilariopsis chorda]